MSSISFHPSIPFIPSPNFSERQGMTVEGVVIHYTAAGDVRGSMSWAQNPVSKVSWHFVISRTGDVFQQVALGKAAWHAGASKMAYRGQLKHGANRFTLGIELANHGLVHQGNDGQFWYETAGEMEVYRQEAEPVKAKLIYANGVELEGWWEPYYDAQLKALSWVLEELAKHDDYRMAAGNLVGHEEIATPFALRKRDPGPLFPWPQFGRPEGRRTRSELTQEVIA